jgi:hypothetical protein
MTKALPRRVHDPSNQIYLRIGDWNPDHPYSNDFACGEVESGLSVYDLDENANPILPPEGEWAQDDLRDRLRNDDPKYVVQGLLRGEGHDGEPLLCDLAIVGEWRSNGWICGPPACQARRKLR